MKYTLLLLPLIVAFQLILNIFIGVVWILPGNAREIPYGIKVDGRDVSGFEPARAVSYLKTVKRNSPITEEIILTDGNREWPLATREYKFSYDHEKTIDNLVAKMEESKGADRIIELLKLQADPVDMPMVFSWDQDQLQDYLQSINDEIYAPARDAVLRLAEGGISIDKETAGKEIDYEKTIDLILQTIQSETPGPVSIATKVIDARITSEDLKMFDAVLSFFVTELNNNQNRSVNIRKAAELIDGTVLMPGEVFSFNDRVGERTRDNGFKSAPVIVRKQMINDIGGGICQVSSTLYNASVLAGLPILERHPHSLNVKYVPNGQDAAVLYGSLDLKLQNNKSNPIRISSIVQDNQLMITILGNHADKMEE